MIDNSSTFFPLAFRMKYIHRWGLMRSSIPENLLEHSAMCAMLAHALAVIGNTYFGKHYDQDRIAVKALYHDISEIYTGDLPTPVKYFNQAITSSYKAIEQNALDGLCEKLPKEVQSAYKDALDHEGENVAADERVLIKAADKLCALIKCAEEKINGNKEFFAAYHSTMDIIKKSCESCKELDYFMKHFYNGFEKPLDEL